MQGRILAVVASVGLIASGYQSATPVAGQAAEPAVRMIADEGEAARYWTRWRGPSGQGLVDGKGYTDTWSATQNVVWKVPVPGSGNSSPIVWRDQIFLTTATDNGNQASILAYRRSDGQRLWEAVVPPGAPDRPHEQERLRVGDGGDGRPAHLRVVRRPRADGGRHERQAGVACRDRPGRELPRSGRLAAALQEQRDPLPGPALGLVRRRVRQGDRQAVVEDAARRAGRVGHADRHPRRRSRRADRPRPEPRGGLQPRHRGRTVAVRRQHVRGDSHAGGRLRDAVLLVGPRRPDAGDSSRRQRRRDQYARRVDDAARVAVRAVAHPVRRPALHDQRHAEHRLGVRREDRREPLAGTAGRRHARGVLRIARRAGRQGVLHQRRRRDVRAAGRQDVRRCCTSTASASGRWRRRRWWTAAGTSAPRSTSTRSARSRGRCRRSGAGFSRPSRSATSSTPWA